MMSREAKYFAMLTLLSVAGSTCWCYRFGGRLYNQPTRPRRLNLNAQYWIQALGMEQHIEGGWFTEVYRSNESISDLPQRYGGGNRTFGTAIYYLLQDFEFSVFHVLQSDELWHFYYGSPISIFVIDPETGTLEVANLGPRENQHFIYFIPRGKIYAARLKYPRQGAYVLVGGTVCPGFEYSDYSQPTRAELIRRFPQHRDQIISLTRI